MRLISLSNWGDDVKEGEYLLVLPYPKDMGEIIAGIKGLRYPPRAVIPPFKLHDPTFTARCAAACMNQLTDVNTGIVIPDGNRRDRMRYITSFQKEGFRPLVFHQDTLPLIQHWAGFLAQSLILEDDIWYHASGLANPFDPPRGQWTYDTQGLSDGP